MKTIFQALAELEENNGRGVLCMVVSSKGATPRRSGSKMLVYADGRTMGSVGGGEVEARAIREALQALDDGKPRLLAYDMVSPEKGDPGVCGGQVEVYVEPVLGRNEIIIVGGGHVGKALAHLARWMNYRVIVSDDRAEFCTAEANPDADFFIAAPMNEIPERAPIYPQTCIVLTTRGTDVDVAGLPTLLESAAGFIGVIGSRRRWALTCKALLEAGVSEEKINRVHSPVGLELEAETPEEIAVSIMAELLMVRNQGSGKPMRAEFAAQKI